MPESPVNPNPFADQPITQPLSSPAKDAAPKKTGLASTIMIVMVTVLVTAVVVFLILLITQSNNGENQIQANAPAAPTSDVEYTNLICTKTASADEAKEAHDAKELKYALTMNFGDDELEDAMQKITYTYGDSGQATTALEELRLAYSDQLLALYEHSDADPFNTNFTTKNNKVTVTHFAEVEELDEKSASLINFPVTDGVVETDLNAIAKALKANEYSCQSKSAE